MHSLILEAAAAMSRDALGDRDTMLIALIVTACWDSGSYGRVADARWLFPCPTATWVMQT